MNNKEKELYKQKADILKALAHPVRLAIVDVLIEKQQTVEEITKLLKERQSNISKHLSILKKTGIVDNKKVGLNRIYYLKYDCISKFSFCVNETLKQKLKEQKQLVRYL